MFISRIFILLTLAAISLGLWIQGGSGASSVKGQFDRKPDDTQYISYGWLKPRRAARRSAEHIWIVKAVAREMNERGLYMDAFGPDLLVRYQLQTNQDVKSSSILNHPAGPIGQEANEWRLTLEFLDSETKVLLWRVARTSCFRFSPERSEKDIYDAVGRMFEEFPAEYSRGTRAANNSSSKPERMGGSALGSSRSRNTASLTAGRCLEFPGVPRFNCG